MAQIFFYYLQPAPLEYSLHQLQVFKVTSTECFLSLLLTDTYISMLSYLFKSVYKDWSTYKKGIINE